MGEEADSEGVFERARGREKKTRYLHDLERQRRSFPLSMKRISGSVDTQSTVEKGVSRTVATARQRKTDYETTIK